MLSTVRPSLFAKSSVPTIVYEELPLTTCINFLPVELKREILSYLHMGIILSLYEQSKSTILYCIKMERMDRRLGCPPVFAEYSARELITIILFLSVFVSVCVYYSIFFSEEQPFFAINVC